MRTLELSRIWERVATESASSMGSRRFSAGFRLFGTASCPCSCSIPLSVQRYRSEGNTRSFTWTVASCRSAVRASRSRSIRPICASLTRREIGRIGRGLASRRSAPQRRNPLLASARHTNRPIFVRQIGQPRRSHIALPGGQARLRRQQSLRGGQVRGQSANVACRWFMESGFARACCWAGGCIQCRVGWNYVRALTIRLRSSYPIQTSRNRSPHQPSKLSFFLA